MNKTKETAAPASYGAALAKKIRTENEDFSRLGTFEHFVLNNGYKYETQETLDAGFGRYIKYVGNVLLTESEFIAETDGDYDCETLKKVYAVLSEMVEEGKIKASTVYRYARFKWCLNTPEAIIAFEDYETDSWIVNNCDIKISEAEALLKINREFGFEASRVEIVGTPYCEASDYMFIRFNCVGYSWLWVNGQLRSVCCD